MPLPPIIKRELEVAFSKDAQPIWFRIVKYILIGTMVYLEHLVKRFYYWNFLAFLVPLQNSRLDKKLRHVEA